jgi:DnaK suppressor protein
MTRRNALLRLQETLLARSADLCKKLAGELADLRDFKAADSTSDSADVAFETSSDEMSSQFAELDARELCQIERSLARLAQGECGICEGGCENCQKRIPLARRNALPFTTFCINCEREMEKYPQRLGRRSAGKRKRGFDSEAPMERQRINLSDLERELTSNRRG